MNCIAPNCGGKAVQGRVLCQHHMKVTRALPAGQHEIEVAAKAETPQETIERLNKRVFQLERELAGAEDRYKQLNGIYQKLADQWNAYQATARPDNRNIHRAEAAGELARKLAEVLIGVAYDKDVSALLREVLERLSDEGPSRPGQTAPRALPEGSPEIDS